MQEQYSDRGLVIAGVTDASREDVEGFIHEHATNFPVLAEAEADREAFGVSMIWGSEFFLLDDGGNILSQDLDEIERMVQGEASR